MLKTIALILIFIIITFSGIPAQEAQARNIIVMLNDSQIVFDVDPIIINGRTLVPIRAISEALGATVKWHTGGSVSIVKGARTIGLKINDRFAQINGEQTLLDVPPMIISNRTLVPLRFISTALNASVDWNPLKMTVSITTAAAVKIEIVSTKGQSLYLGMSTNALKAVLGEPLRIEPTLYSYDWWVYNNQPGGVVLAGVDNNTLSAIYTDNPNWAVASVSPGNGFDVLKSKYALADRLSINHEGIRFNIYLEPDVLREKPLVLINGKFVSFYLDLAREGEVAAIRAMDAQTFLATGSYSKSWQTIGGRTIDLGLPALSEAQRAAAFDAQERIMFDLVNSFRRRNGLSALTWHNELSIVAYNHSVDMFVNNFFSHVSPRTGSPGDRVRNANITFRRVGENLVVGTADSMNAHHLLLNSPGHRSAIVFPTFTHLGIGIIERYYTQKFITQ